MSFGEAFVTETSFQAYPCETQQENHSVQLLHLKHFDTDCFELYCVLIYNDTIP